MDSLSRCKEKLQYFRIKELKDVLTQIGLAKQGKKQDLVDRILALLSDDQASLQYLFLHLPRKRDPQSRRGKVRSIPL